VQFESGEPEMMTKAEKDRLEAGELLGQVRLACQITCQNDMSVTPLMPAENQPHWNGDTGPAPQESITPTPEW
jgi:ferredoxin